MMENINDIGSFFASGVFSPHRYIMKQFGITKDIIKEYDILYVYEPEQWAFHGTIFILLYKLSDNKLYEVNGSHCSCSGYKDQWDPEETTVEALLLRHNGIPDPYENFMGSIPIHSPMSKCINEYLLYLRKDHGMD